MDGVKLLKMIRDAEDELVFANPKKAAKLAKKIVKWKALFSERF